MPLPASLTLLPLIDSARLLRIPSQLVTTTARAIQVVSLVVLSHSFQGAMMEGGKALAEGGKALVEHGQALVEGGQPMASEALL